MHKPTFTMLAIISSLLVNSALAALSVPARIELRSIDCIVTLNYQHSKAAPWHQYDYSESCSGHKDRVADVLLHDNQVLIRYSATPDLTKQYLRFYHGKIINDRNIQGIMLKKYSVKHTYHYNPNLRRYIFPTSREDFNGTLSGSVPVRQMN